MVKNTYFSKLIMEKSEEGTIIEELVASAKTLTELKKALDKGKFARKSVQALFKQLNKMVEEGKLEKKGTKYSISKKWILRNKKFFDSLYRKISRKKNEPLLLEDYEEYYFDTLFDLDNFWNDADYQISDKAEEKNVYVKVNYYWWFVLNLSYELTLWKNLKKKGFEIKFIITKDNLLNRWAKKVLEENSYKVTIKKSNDEPQIDYTIFDKTIIQVNYDKKTAKTIQSIFSKYQSINKISAKELSNLSSSKGKVQLKIIKNKPLADEMKKEFNP